MLKLNDQLGYGVAAVTATLTQVQVESIFRWISLGITILVGMTTLILNVVKSYKAAIQDKVITKEEGSQIIKQSREDIQMIVDELEKIKTYIK